MIKKYQILYETLNNVIQNSGLDVGAAYFIVKDILHDLEVLYYSQINSECLSESSEEEIVSDNTEDKK